MPDFAGQLKLRLAAELAGNCWSTR